MKLYALAIIAFALGASAMPEPDNAVITEGENTYIGIDKVRLFA